MKTDDIEHPCENYAFCKKMLPDFMKRCIGCDSFGLYAIPFYNVEDEECPVCLRSHVTSMEFPTKCGHRLCVECARDIIFWDETRYHLDPTSFGAPACPNGCQNPIRGRQCYCEEYDEVINKWERDKPLAWKAWNDAEHASIDNSPDDDEAYASGKCPLCRQKYTG